MHKVVGDEILDVAVAGPLRQLTQAKLCRVGGRSGRGQEVLERLRRNDKSALLDYSDEATYREAGQGGFEIRNFIAVAAAARGQAEVWYYRPIPIFAVGCTVAVMTVER